MISWIQRTFQRHTKLVFLFLLLVITIPFVFTIGAAPGISPQAESLEKAFLPNSGDIVAAVTALI